MAGYYGSTDASISATGDNMAAGESKVYTFAKVCPIAWVFIKAATSATIYGCWNAASASASDADFELNAADGLLHATSKGSPHLGVMVETVALYTAEGAILNTDFFVRGRAL